MLELFLYAPFLKSELPIKIIFFLFLSYLSELDIIKSFDDLVVFCDFKLLT
ncbi:hypothetical protein RRG54_03335 [Mycoplasmopsis felis]|uniref:hypothetical protein n=1 Tax=Mycoplasmopsis felis TaxID=33923 RepID=UPI002B003959|nr:hypothetical protein [Mycoplasmopsis felis]WQQ05870.1 hypothetical protein RRG40_02010 [Mycoplasmopsis felis]